MSVSELSLHPFKDLWFKTFQRIYRDFVILNGLRSIGLWLYMQCPVNLR